MKVAFNDRGNPAGKLADAELNFTDGSLTGLKPIGFSVRERRTGGRNVMFPARQYSVYGKRRSFALLRPIAEPSAQDAVRAAILAAYADGVCTTVDGANKAGNSNHRTLNRSATQVGGTSGTLARATSGVTLQ